MSDVTFSPSLIAGEAESLRASPLAAEPTTAGERLATMDILRGVALLGILVLNIDFMGSPMQAHGVALDAFAGPHAGLNELVLTLKWAFFEGKMRGLFSMLFGAGVVLLTERFTSRGGAAQVADIYVRRNMWLLAIGMVHGIFIWSGDILFMYGIGALLVLYPFRLLQARTLLIIGTLLSLFLATAGALYYTKLPDNLSLGREVATLEARQKGGETLGEEDLKKITAWKALVSPHVADKAAFQKDVAEVVDRSYAGSVADNFKDNFVGPSAAGHYIFMFDNISAMLIGMGLFRNGFLTGRKSSKVYAWTAAIGFAVSLPLYLFGVWKVHQAGFATLSIKLWLFVPYYLTREAGSIAIAAVVLLSIKQHLFKRTGAWIGSVGRTALSNYLLTSLVAQFFFVWGPWKLYGKLEYYQLLYVVGAIWLINIVASNLWLRAFRFGPVEWVWRSLTYARLQPMRRANEIKAAHAI